jgi:Ca2+-binding EF-hand superfamily protein
MRESTAGSTLLEQGLASFATSAPQVENFSAPVGTSAYKSMKEAEREFAMDRRGVGSHFNKLGFYDKVDHIGDDFADKVSSAWWTLSCAEISSSSNSSAKPTSHADALGDDLSMRLGLPDFADGGYILVQHGEQRFEDGAVPHTLQMQVAVHKKTSIERLCLCKRKSRLLPGVSREHVMSAIRTMKKLEHVNILRLLDAYEDDSNLYFLYENYPCVTLRTALPQHTWTEEQIVNLVREICAASAYALGAGVHHLGWTLAHILLPPTSLKEDAMISKIFGFGLVGLFMEVDTSDMALWAPEAVEFYSRLGDNFSSKLENVQKGQADAWSLGAIVYSIIARRKPLIQDGGSWSFTVAFDQVDREAKELCEKLMQKFPARRLKVDQCFCNPWIRRRWKAPGHVHHVFSKLEDFCSSPLPKRLFGRFLVRFLDAEQMRVVAKAYYSLDGQGSGNVDASDLKRIGKMIDCPSQTLNTISSWLMSGGATSFSVFRFAETMAEEVIDGKALRHSFESLDEDGSEQICPQELFDTLKHYSSDLKMEQVLEHIAKAEGRSAEVDNEEQSKDHKIDFQEYVRLFPVRLRRLQKMEERLSSTMNYGQDACTRYQQVEDQVAHWIKSLDNECHMINKLCLECGDKKGPESVKQLRAHCGKAAELLKHPPGPADYEAHMDLWNSISKKKKKGEQQRRVSKGGGPIDKTPGVSEVFGFDSFMQTQALHAWWPMLIDNDRATIKNCMHHDSVNNALACDYFRASDAGQNVVKKIDEVLEWAKFQVEEYKSFVDVLTTSEGAIPQIGFSSRGLQSHGEEADGHMQDDEGSPSHGDDAKAGIVSRFMFKAWSPAAA